MKRSPYGPELHTGTRSFFLFIRSQIVPLVCADGTKRLCQHAGNALRALKVMQIQRASITD